MTGKGSLLRTGLLILALLFWLAGTLPFWWGGPALYYDGASYAKYTNFFLCGLQHGVMPSWDPFNFWGRPSGAVMARAVCIWDPFYLIIPLLGKIGVSFAAAYTVVLITYYFFGVIGFYRILSLVFKEFTTAFTGTLLVLFSTLGHNIFNDTQIVLGFTNAVWFFYALLAFRAAPDGRRLLMIMFWVMLNLVTYIPFPFLTLVFLSTILGLLLFPRELFALAGDGVRVIRSRPRIGGVLLLCVAAALMPEFLWWLSAQTGKFVWEGRSSTGTTGVEMTRVTLEEINKGAQVFIYHDLRNLFSAWNDLKVYNFFMPLTALVLFVVGAWGRINRRMVFSALMALLIVLISFGDASWVHGTLYRLVFFFHLYRNLHFFVWLALPFTVFFLMDIFHQFFVAAGELKRPDGRTAVIAAHGIVWIGVLLFGENVPVWVHVDLAVSLAFFWFLVQGVIRDGLVVCVLFLGVVVLNAAPAFMMIGHQPSPEEKKCLAGVACPARLDFVYVRPVDDSADTLAEVGTLRDRAGFDAPNNWFRGAQKVYQLRQQLPQEDLTQYVRYKFLVYDHVTVAPALGPAALGPCLRDFCGSAWVQATEVPFSLSGTSAAPLRVRGPHDGVTVTDFQFNRIELKTVFTQEKFLVYNDAFDAEWLATVNGKPARIWLANGAFKGLYLPAGEDRVVFQYRPLPRRMLSIIVLLTFYVLGLYLAATAFRRRKIGEKVN